MCHRLSLILMMFSVCVTAHAWRADGSLSGVGSLRHHVGPNILTHGVLLCDKHPYPLSRLTSLKTLSFK